MRIGVDYRVLSVGKEQIKRGLARFTQQQLRAVLDVDDANEYVLLCTERSDLSLINPAIRNRVNVTVRRFRSSGPEQAPPDPALFLRQAEEFQAWIAAQEIDLYHATAPFVPDPPFLVRFDACPMVANFYDVIPLVFPDHYLTGWWRERYERMLCLLLDAERLIAISGAAGQDAVTYLGYPSGRIHVAWPIPDLAFRSFPAETVAAGLEGIRRRVKVPERFVLTVSHFHHSKNLPTLLRAYALIPSSVRAGLPLVICCHLDPHEAERVMSMASDFGVADDIVLTGLLSDDELALLYNAALLVVHPSRYEGFGLPVAEAMSCGTPVITTTSSSMPEVAGDAAVLVGPDDAESLAEQIEATAADPARRHAMAERGLAHVTRFNAAQLAQATLEAYRMAVAAPAREHPGPRRPRIAIWTPFPPQPSGIADYSVELVQTLQARYDVEVFIGDGCLPAPGLLHQHRVQHASGFPRRHRQEPFDVAIYQVGRSLLHLYSYEQFRTAPPDLPAIVAFHDLTWSHVLFAEGAEKGDFRPFRRHLAELEGEAAGRAFDLIQLADPAIRHQLLDQFLYEHPMLCRLVEGSAAQVVHLEEAERKLRTWYPTASVHTVPMGVRDPCAHDLAAHYRSARRARGIADDTFVVGTFGVLHPLKRLDPCLRAFADLVRARPDSLLLMVGRDGEDGYTDELQRLSRQLGIASQVRFTGHVGPSQFDDLLLGCDVVVNLRAQSSTHLSAIALRAVAAGKPVLISDLEDWRFLPDEPFLRVATGDDERATLAARLHALASDDDERRRLAAVARDWFEQTATLERMAQGYSQVIDSVLVAPPPAPPSREEGLASVRRQ